MKASMCLFIACAFSFAAAAQHNTTYKVHYVSWVYLTDTHTVLKGAILKAEDDGIQFIPRAKRHKKKIPATVQPQIIPVSAIRELRFRKTNKPGKGVLIGAISGAVAGAVIGYASGDDTPDPGSLICSCSTAEEKASAGALLGLFPGMAIGALFGTTKTKVYINSDPATYRNALPELQQYTVLPDSGAAK